MTKQVKVKNNRPRLYTANGVTLQPGLNTLSQDDANKFLSHPHIAIKVERGFIEVVDGKVTKTVRAETPADTGGDSGEAGNTTPAVNLDGKTAPEIVELAKTSDDTAFLESLLSHEFKTVQKAAQARLDALKGSGE